MTYHKSALITGASRGIGKAIAYEFAQKGYHLYLTCKNNLSLLKKIKIEEFNADTYNEFNNYYHALNIIGIEKLIIDLRDNPGGYVSQCIMVGNLVVPRGNITVLKYKNEDEEMAYRSLCDKHSFF